MQQPQRITACRVLGDHKIEITFDDGFVGRLVLEEVLWGPVFEPLRDPRYFRRVRIEGDTIRWPNDADFCPDVLRCWCEAGRVLSQEETDACFQPPSVSAA